METTSNTQNHDWPSWQKHNSRLGKVLGGIVLIATGITLLLNQTGAIVLPPWIFTWEVLLIMIGIYIGAKHAFRHNGWVIPVAIGAVFLIDDIMPGTSVTPYVWPILIIAAGAFMIFSPKRKRNYEKWKNWQQKYEDYKSLAKVSDEDIIESVSVFGGVKKNIISKNFKGGEVVTVFGGAEINLSQADIQGRVTLDVSQVFGGAKLIVPPHWDIQSELVSVLGGIEDKRPIQKDHVIDSNKVLLLKGTLLMGGIEIRSF